MRFWILVYLSLSPYCYLLCYPWWLLVYLYIIVSLRYGFCLFHSSYDWAGSDIHCLFTLVWSDPFCLTGYAHFRSRFVSNNMCANIDWLHRDIIQNVDPAFRYVMKWMSLITLYWTKLLFYQMLFDLKMI